MSSHDNPRKEIMHALFEFADLNDLSQDPTVGRVAGSTPLAQVEQLGPHVLPKEQYSFRNLSHMIYTRQFPQDEPCAIGTFPEDLRLTNKAIRHIILVKFGTIVFKYL